MRCKITRNAAKKLREALNEEESAGKKIRVYVTHQHGDHAHYAISLDEPKEDDVVVQTDKEIDVLLSTKEAEFLDGVKIDYLYLPQEGFEITNPGKGNTGHHH